MDTNSGEWHQTHNGKLLIPNLQMLITTVQQHVGLVWVNQDIQVFYTGLEKCNRLMCVT